MKKLRRTTASVLFFFIFCASVLPGQVIAAENPPLFGYGWEHWKVSSVKDERGVWQYDMRCPADNVSMETLKQYTLAIMAYCKAANPSPTTVTIHYNFTENLDEIGSRLTQAIHKPVGIMSVSSVFLNLVIRKTRLSEDYYESILTLDVNNPYSVSPYTKEIPYGASLEVAAAVASSIASKTDNPREQVRLINEYLVKNVEYGSVNNERRAHSIVGVFLDGKAMCAGYTDAVSSLCHLLDIPCYQLYDRKNNHIWNVVNIDGKWLMVDVTYNDTGTSSTKYLLSDGFDDKLHNYEKEMLHTINGYMEQLWSAQNAAEALQKKGILQGTGDNGFELSRPLTHEEFAVVLTRLDGVDISKIPKTNIKNCPSWAAPHVAYCISAGYFDSIGEYRSGGRLTVAAVKQVLIDYYASSATVREAPATEKLTITGTTLLRGQFFEMVVRCYA